MATVPIMNVAIADAVSRGGPIMIDVTDLTFMDSSGVGSVIGSVNTFPGVASSCTAPTTGSRRCST